MVLIFVLISHLISPQLQLLEYNDTTLIYGYWGIKASTVQVGPLFIHNFNKKHILFYFIFEVLFEKDCFLYVFLCG